MLRITVLVIFCFFVGSLFADTVASPPHIEKSDEGSPDIDPYEVSDEDVDPYEISEEDEGEEDVDPYEVSNDEVKEHFVECSENKADKKLALALYISCKRGEQEEFTLEKISRELERLSENCEIYICPQNGEEIAWAMRTWPNYKILLQPRGTSLQQVQQTTNTLLQRGHEKVALVLNPYTYFPKEYIEQSYLLLDENKIVVGSFKEGGLYLLSTKCKWPQIAKERSFDPLRFADCLTLLQSKKGKGFELPIRYPAKSAKEMRALARQFIAEGEQQSQIKEWVYQNIKVSIVIPLCNEVERVENLVHSLRELSPKPQLIFVDGGSNDGTVDKLSSLQQEVYSVPRGCTRAAALNKGATLAMGEYILFMHPNCSLPQESYSRMITLLASKQIEAGAFSLQLQTERRNPILKVLEKGSSLRCKLFKMAYGNQGYFITKEALQRVGPYQEMAIMEDIEWFARVKKECVFTLLKEPIENMSKLPYEKGHIYSSIKNCCLVSLYKIGVKPERLSKVSNYKKGYFSSKSF